jgi:Macrocin-O-methyltransferase (TylF)
MTQDTAVNSPTSLIARTIRWLKKPNAERNRLLIHKLQNISALPFYFGRTTLGKIFIAYQPDSHNSFNAHPEFNNLLKKFTKLNRTNNAGDVVRVWSFILNIKQIIAENVEGDFAELGVWRGNTASVLAYYGAIYNRKVVLFDTYEGFNKKDLEGIDADKEMAFEDTSISLVKDVIGEESKVCEFVKGYFPESLRERHKAKKYAVISLDCDLYEPMKAGLNCFYPLMTKGGIFLLHDYSSCCWAGAKKAIDEFCEKNNEYIILIPDKSGSAFFRKTKSF